MNRYCVSKGSFYHAGTKFLNSVLTFDALDINLLTKASEWGQVRKAFASKSLNQVLTGCCGAAINGFF
jgi:hypothetical protein